MKLKKVFNVFCLIMLSLVVFSCGEDIPGYDDENGSGSSGGSNNLTTGQIEIKVYPGSNNKVSFGIKAKSSICKMTVEQFNNLSCSERKFAMSLNS
jgi:hypothetical protein